MARGLRYLGQAVVYAVVGLGLGTFADSPAFDRIPADRAQLLLSFSHAGARKGACRKLTREEIEALARNMRRTEVCPRERLPIRVELEVSGSVLYRADAPPTGIWSDGASQVYKRLLVAPGTHHVVARLRQDPRSPGFDFEKAAEVALTPGQNYVIDFRAEHGGFLFGSQSTPR